MLFRSTGRADEAIAWLEKMQEEKVKANDVTYNTVINALATTGRADDAIAWFEKMQEEKVKANEVTYSTVSNALAKTGRADEAIAWFEKMQEEKVKADEVTYSTVISALARGGNYRIVKVWLAKMVGDGLQPNRFTFYSVFKSLRNSAYVSAADVVTQLDAARETYGIVLDKDHAKMLGKQLQRKRVVQQWLLAHGELPPSPKKGRTKEGRRGRGGAGRRGRGGVRLATEAHSIRQSKGVERLEEREEEEREEEEGEEEEGEEEEGEEEEGEEREEKEREGEEREGEEGEKEEGEEEESEEGEGEEEEVVMRLATGAHSIRRGKDAKRNEVATVRSLEKSAVVIKRRGRELKIEEGQIEHALLGKEV